MYCNKCGVELYPVENIQVRRRDDFPNMRDALVIDIRGGYGMYKDEGPCRIVICGNDAEQFLKDNVWISRFYDQYAGNIYND